MCKWTEIKINVFVDDYKFENWISQMMHQNISDRWKEKKLPRNYPEQSLAIRKFNLDFS